MKDKILSDKLTDAVLITGASRGIGLATAKRLAAEGRAVIGLARNPPDNFPGLFVEADLADRDATDQLLQAIADSHEISGLVNNLGLNVLQRVDDVNLDSFDRVIDLNLKLSIQCVQAFLPGMRARKYGRIVNISSRGALGRINRTSYSAAKAGIIGMTRTWAVELASDGITVNVVSPGATATEMFRKNNLEGKDPAVVEGWLSEIPMRRFGEPDEIAAGIAFFLSPAASYITGQTLHVCGGMTIGLAAM
ncbi:MAG: SDR family oxidoreductase [Hyphomicrobiaceae bacterium]